MTFLRRFSLLLVAALILNTWAVAQSTSNASTVSIDPAVQAQTVSTRSPFETAGERRVQNFFDLGLNSQSGYIDHVSGAANVGGSFFEDLSGSVDVQQKRGGLNWALSYNPIYDWYRRAKSLNRFDQAGAVQISDQLNEHWFVRLSDTASYGRYLINPAALSGQPSGPLNLGVATPRVLQYSQSPSASLVYVANYRSSFQFSGNYIMRRFSEREESNLSDLRGAGGSAAYQYRVSPRSTVGAEYSYENASFGRGIGHMVEQTAMLTYEHVLGPNTEVSFAAGPQRVHETENLNQLFGIPAGIPLPTTLPSQQPYRTYFAAQGALQHQAGPTALSLSAQRSVRDSGGLTANAAQVTSVSLGAGRLIAEVWHVNAAATYERMTAANLIGATGAFQGVIASGGIDRSLGPAWRLSARFATSHQRRTGNLPFGGALNSNSISLGISYNLRLRQE